MDRGRLVGNRLALAGAVLYLLEWAVIPFAPSLPTDKLGSDPAAIAAAYADHPGRTGFLAGWLGVVLLGRLLFVGALRQAVRLSGRDSLLLDFAVAAMTVSVAIEIVSYGLVGAGAWLADRHVQAAAIAALDAACSILTYAVFAAAAVSVFAASAAMLASRLFARWLSWLGIVSGALLAFGGVVGPAALGLHGSFHDIGGAATSAVIGLWIWMLATSVVLYRRAPRRAAASPELAAPHSA
jgi:hypothetical protein